MNLKMLESFLMSVEVIYYLKKQMKLEKTSQKRSCLQFFKRKRAKWYFNK